MFIISNIDQVMDILKILAQNKYSPLWHLIDDFTFNNHYISIKDSNQFNHIIIDGCMQAVAGCTVNGLEPLDYIKDLLTK